MALGITLDNEPAARLYRRHGFRSWRHPPVATFREEFMADGRRRCSPEVCQIMVKDLG